jgi:hypothetical protein
VPHEKMSRTGRDIVRERIDVRHRTGDEVLVDC